MPEPTAQRKLADMFARSKLQPGRLGHGVGVFALAVLVAVAFKADHLVSAGEVGSWADFRAFEHAWQLFIEGVKQIPGLGIAAGGGAWAAWRKA